MEYSLQAYFDIGVSFGLGDAVFVKSASHVNVPDILKIGIRNPLGLGIQYRVDEHNPEVIAEWRRHARSKVDNPEMDLGYDDSLRGGATKAPEFETFRQDLRNLIEVHPIALCELTIYAIGVVFMRLDLSRGIPVYLIQGVSHCFEYAAYLEPVSMALLNVAKRAVDNALERPPRKWWRRDVDVGIQGLSKRPDPETQTDERGYKESKLFTGFTHVAMCVDEGDNVEEIKRRIQPIKGDTNEPDSETLVFEYHGKIHFNWAACVLEPKSFDDPYETPRQQIQRMLLCIQIAHTFQGACDAFERLFFHETIHQADGYIKGKPVGRNHVELNRLRTLALAVVSLTNFAPVAAAEEDQSYFKAYNKNAKLDDMHELILTRSDILLNVQQAEAEEERARRELYLNTVVLMLTGFTLLSVLADTYGFIRGEERWFQAVVDRAKILAGIVLMLVVTLFSLGKIVRRRTKR
jgi:hypothetical protein